MALVKCSECTNDISDKAKLCPHCGYEIGSSQSSLEAAGSKMQSIGCGLTLFVTIPILLLFFFMSGC